MSIFSQFSWISRRPVSICWLTAFLVSAMAGTAIGQLTSAEIQNLKEHGKLEGWTFTVGENPATELPDEFLCGVVEPENWKETARFDPCTPTRSLPSAHDWRELDGCTPIRYQGQCGSCWAFGTIAALECAIRIKDGDIVDLSEQWLVSCNKEGYGCYGGWFSFEYFESTTDWCGDPGAVLEEDFPYMAADLPCGCPYKHPYGIESWAYIGMGYDTGVEEIKQAILDYGPVATLVHVDDAFIAYTGGVFNASTPGSLNHLVNLVGWDDNLGSEGAWIMRNSWGPGWGSDGYMYIEYNCSEIGEIAAYVNYTGLPKLSFSYPDGLPIRLEPDQPTEILVELEGVFEGMPVANSGLFNYSFDGDIFGFVDMEMINLIRYRAVIPALPCGDCVDFFFNVDVTTGELESDPGNRQAYRAYSGVKTVQFFEDDFSTDKGWTVTGDAINGHWERAIPVDEDNKSYLPDFDFDGSGMCYLTSNEPGVNVDSGTTSLISPIFDLSSGDGFIHYARWYYNGANFIFPLTDVLNVYISNDDGQTWTHVEQIGPTTEFLILWYWGSWYEHTFWAGHFVTPTDQMRLKFEASDFGIPTIVEAGIDDIYVIGVSCDTTPEPPRIVTSYLPDWTAGQPFSHMLEVVEGAGALIWNDKYNDLAGSGLALAGDGLISGIPLQSGSISFIAQVADEYDSTDEKTFTFLINDSLKITTTSPPDWTVGVEYLHQLESSGGTGNHAWSDLNDGLGGTGLSLSIIGNITGIPETAGSVNFMAEVVDDIGAAETQELSFFLNPAVEITTTSLPDCTTGVQVEYILTCSGGTGPITWTDHMADLELTDFTLSTDGILSGRPTTVDTLTFTARAEDAVGGFDEAPIDLNIFLLYICGDTNGDENVNVGDAVYLINHIFKGGPAPEPNWTGDTNGDLTVNIGDAVYLINYVFKNGSAPACF